MSTTGGAGVPGFPVKLLPVIVAGTRIDNIAGGYGRVVPAERERRRRRRMLLVGAEEKGPSAIVQDERGPGRTTGECQPAVRAGRENHQGLARRHRHRNYGRSGSVEHIKGRVRNRLVVSS